MAPRSAVTAGRPMLTRLAALPRGTFLGSAWGPFQDVKKVWAEHFGSKSYKSHALGIAGNPSCSLLCILSCYDSCPPCCPAGTVPCECDGALIIFWQSLGTLTKQVGL